MEQAIAIVQELAKKHQDRLDQYVADGGQDPSYLEGKSQAFYDVLKALIEANQKK